MADVTRGWRLSVFPFPRYHLKRVRAQRRLTKRVRRIK
jgi:hypothetical protein